MPRVIPSSKIQDDSRDKTSQVINPVRVQPLRRVDELTSEAPVVIILSRPKFASLWLFVFILRIICACFLYALSAIYALLTVYEMGYYAQLIAPHQSQFFTCASWICLLLACAHCYRLLKMLLASMLSKSLAFRKLSSPNQPPANLISNSRGTACFLFMWRLYTRLFDRQGYFGVESPYFYWRFLLQELAEMVSQTAQAYSSSILISRLWINRLYVSIVFINSWSTPVAQHFARHSPVLERIMCFTTDMTLDLISAIVIPLALFIPYVLQFDPATSYFAGDALYNDVWYTNMVMEFRQLIASNSLNLAMRLMPHVSIYFSLGNIEALVNPEQKAVPDNSKFSRIESKKKVPETIESARLQRMQSHQLHNRQAVIVHLLFFAWGLVVLAVHLHAVYGAKSTLSSGGHVIGCRQRTYPWLTTKFACSVYEYNCYRQGTTTPLANSLELLDEKSVAVLIMSHCTALTVPQSIQTFPNLLGLNIWNSTIVDWPQTAEINQQTHPTIVSINLVNSNMTRIPDGLLSDDLPMSLQDIEITHCHIGAFPEDLDVKWRFVLILYVEYCGLTELPDVFKKLKMPDFSLVGNQLKTLPIDNLGHGYLSLSNNPLTELPERIGDWRELRFLAVEKTRLQNFPEWVFAAAEAGARVIAYETPFCETQSVEDRQIKSGQATTFTCSNTNTRMNGRYPFEAMKALQRP